MQVNSNHSQPAFGMAVNKSILCTILGKKRNNEIDKAIPILEEYAKIR